MNDDIIRVNNAHLRLQEILLRVIYGNRDGERDIDFAELEAAVREAAELGCATDRDIRDIQEREIKTDRLWAIVNCLNAKTPGGAPSKRGPTP